MHEFLPAGFVFLQVVFIDLVLAGDNAIVVGMAAAGLPAAQRSKAIIIGIGAATLLRIGFAAFATLLLAIVGLLLAGGILLLWVCWKMFRDIRGTAEHEAAAVGLTMLPVETASPAPRVKSLGQAVWQIVAADVSMSIDNVLAVSGAAQGHPIVLILGLTLSVVLMGVAASMIARLLARQRWIAYVGLSIILFVAASMIYRGGFETFAAMRLPS